MLPLWLDPGLPEDLEPLHPAEGCCGRIESYPSLPEITVDIQPMLRGFQAVPRSCQNNPFESFLVWALEPASKAQGSALPNPHGNHSAPRRQTRSSRRVWFSVSEGSEGEKSTALNALRNADGTISLTCRSGTDGLYRY